MKTLLQIIFLVFLSSSLTFAQIGFDNDSPDPSAVLDLNATDKGLLIPRMTTQEREAIVSPANSLLVFDTSLNNYFYYTNNQWVSLTNWSSSASNDDVYLESGSVGIGTSTPERPLEVYSETTVAPIRMTSNRGGGADSYVEFKNKTSSQPNSAIGLGRWNSMEGEFVIKLGNGEATPQEKFRILANGNVGIGTISPDYTLDVNGPINTSALNINGTSFSVADLHPVTNGVAATTAYNDWDDYGNTGFYMGHNLMNQPPNLSGAHTWKYVTVIRHNDLYCVQYATDFSHKANWTRVKSGGNWGPWKRSFDYYDSSADEIRLWKIRSDNPFIQLLQTSGSAQRMATGGILISNNYSNDIGKVPTNGIWSKGNIISNGTITPLSDMRLKDNIVQIDNALEKVGKIEGVYFTRKDLPNKERRYIGFVADQLLNVVPELVIVPEDPEQMKSVNYSQTTALLVEAIKEQQAQIELLKAEIKELKK